MVVPPVIIALPMIIGLGELRAFKITGSIIFVFGALITVGFLLIERYLYAMQSTLTISWLVIILGITLGKSEPLNSAVMATLCTIVTTAFLLILATIPQNFVKAPFKRAGQILLLLYFVELPIAILCHYHDISHNPWQPWILPVSIQGILVLFFFIVMLSSVDLFFKSSQFIIWAIFSIGVPMTMVWGFSPMHGNHVPRYGLLCITFGCLLVFALGLRFFKTFSGHTSLRFLSWVCSGATMMSWLPALLWTGNVEAFAALTRKRSATIHVTWGSILFWILVWVAIGPLYLRENAESRRRRIYSQPE
jgi:hypothetical protein